MHTNYTYYFYNYNISMIVIKKIKYINDKDLKKNKVVIVLF